MIKIELRLHERFGILQFFRDTTGNIPYLKLVSDLIKKLEFTDEETQIYKTTKNLNDLPVPFELTELEFNALKNEIKRLNEIDKLPLAYLSLYEKILDPKA